MPIRERDLAADIGQLLGDVPQYFLKAECRKRLDGFPIRMCSRELVNAPLVRLAGLEDLPLVVR